MPERALAVVDAEIVAANGRAGAVTFAEVWADHFVLHAVLERRMEDDLGNLGLGSWTCADEAGTSYRVRRSGCKLRDSWWSIEVVLAPAVPLNPGRLTISIPQIDGQAVVEPDIWPTSA